MSIPIQIVQTGPEHIESFHAALDAVARERRYLGRTAAPPLEKLRAFVLVHLEKRMPHFVAVGGGDVIGWCEIEPIDRDTQTHCGILGMGLLPAARGQGVGRRLMVQTLDAAQQRGLTRVELTVYDDNAPAIALYQALGFEREGLKRRAARIDGVDKNMILMAIIDLDRWAAPVKRT